MPVTPEALALQAELDAQASGVVDAQSAVLIAAWAAAWAEVSGDLQDAVLDLLVAAAETGRVTRAAMLRSVRLRAVLVDINAQLRTLTTEAGVTITSDLDQVVADAADAQLAIARAQLPEDDDDLPEDVADVFDGGVSPRTQRVLAGIVQRTAEDITSRLRPVDAETAAAVRAELVRGIAVGENPRKTAARMVERTEQRFNGGLNRALNIARTEMIDAHRAAAEAEQAADADVLAGWTWLCHLDTRTCPSCLVRHGELHELDEPGPQDHPQGRCARMPKTKSWADLGIDLDEPEDVVPDARAWFDALTEAEQRTILGPTRYRLLIAGDIDWADLSKRRDNAGWRPSWQVTPVRELAGTRTRAAS